MPSKNFKITLVNDWRIKLAEARAKKTTAEWKYWNQESHNLREDGDSCAILFWLNKQPGGSSTMFKMKEALPNMGTRSRHYWDLVRELRCDGVNKLGIIEKSALSPVNP
jgi:hypothetical protein